MCLCVGVLYGGEEVVCEVEKMKEGRRRGCSRHGEDNAEECVREDGLKGRKMRWEDG